MSTTLPAELQISRHDSTLVLTLRDPASRNALSPALYAAAIAALDDAARERHLKINAGDNTPATTAKTHA